MEFEILGSGNSAHLPVYGCHCAACDQARREPAHRRGKTSAVLSHNGHRLLLDANHPELLSRFPAGTIDTIVLTHFHMDHVISLFDLRWGVGDLIDVLTPPDDKGCDDLYKHPGILRFSSLKAFHTFEWQGVAITPLPLNHTKPCFGYLFESDGLSVAYLTDTYGLPDATLAFLKGRKLDLMLIDCSFPPVAEGEHRKTLNHNDLSEVRHIASLLNVARVGLIHIDHTLDCWALENPTAFDEQLFLCRDGQRFSDTCQTE